ncbi:early nodulin 1 [Olea europaea subsp. europaea]|uniref:Early nodulin 1 n=1 Tax=Olea europaea subsp. europaea TaxID=158383 RepID=A0A8S0PM51_OLEEU|nr:early nodulin 1 [Olea europaea subsp. europaea]
MPTAAQTMPEHGLDIKCQKLPTNAWKLGCVPIAARARLERGLHTVPKNFPKMPENQIGDSLVLKYNSKTHSVLEVNEKDYKICNNANPIKSHNDRENQAASLPRYAGKSVDVPVTVRMHLGLGQHTVPTNCLEMPENHAVSLPGQEASRTWPIHRAQKLPEIA